MLAAVSIMSPFHCKARFPNSTLKYKEDCAFATRVPKLLKELPGEILFKAMLNFGRLVQLVLIYHIGYQVHFVDHLLCLCSVIEGPEIVIPLLYGET